MGNLFDKLRALWQKPPDPSQSDTSYLPSTIDQDTRKLFTVLNIEEDLVKAAIVEVKGDQVFVLGVGRHTFNKNHISDGIVTDISGAISNCNEALLEAEAIAGGIIAPDTVIGISGMLVQSASTMVSKIRQQPSTRISPKELGELISGAQQKLLKSAKERIVEYSGFENIEVRLTNTSILATRVDGQLVSNPIGFRGSHFSVMLSSTFAPLIQLAALETVSQGLDLTLITISAESCGLAFCLSTNAARGAIFINIGSDTTTITLVRQGGIEDTRMFSLGNRTFTRHIATTKGLSLKDAEWLKNNYSNGNIAGSDLDEIKAILAPECQTWMDNIDLLIEELAKGEFLPTTIYMLSERLALPDLFQRLEHFPWTERLPFLQTPIIYSAHPGLIEQVIDTDTLLGKEDVILAALAYNVLTLAKPADSIDEALSQVTTGVEIKKEVPSPSEKNSLKFSVNGSFGVNNSKDRYHSQNTLIPMYKFDYTSKTDRSRYDPRRHEALPPDRKVLPLSPRYDYPRSGIEPSRDNAINNRNSPTPLRRSLRIFLCHASDDKKAVNKLYQKLKADGFNPWLDENKLLPGQDWQVEIPKAVRNSHIVIVCLSHNSIHKTGYVQKEIKYALDVADEQTEGTVFMIPLKLEECKVPDRLSRWQWVNFFEKDGYTRLLFALRKRAKDI